MNLGEPLESNPKSPVLVEPGQGSLNHPSASSKAAAMRCSTPGQERLDPTGTKHPAMRFGIVCPVRKHTPRSATGMSPTTSDGRDLVHERNELRNVVPIGFGQTAFKGNALCVRDEMMLAPQFPPIRWIRARFRPPKTARTEALSAEARDQLIWCAWFNRAKRPSCSLSQIPAFCQSRRRRQQVIHS